ncbi:MAG: SbcC/MukB-like Walker B domain-containing protein [Rhodoglobus sp.]
MTLDFALGQPTGDHPGQWRLAHIELANWGTFNGHHVIDVARKGHLLTGASGSGKSSLLDAIAAVLTPGRIRFNAAAQDTADRSNDRDFVSYVRGAWSREVSEYENKAVASYLRGGRATWSGVLLRYENLVDAPITLVRLFHIKGASVDRADLADACVIVRTTPSLVDFKPYAEGGLDVRRMKAELDPVIVTSGGANGQFFARIRTLFNMQAENALVLLHRTQSAKSLGSLDDLFRNFMLDRPTTFDRADNAVTQFTELKEAYDHVVDLRKQAEALTRIDEIAKAFEMANAEVTATRDLAEAVPGYVTTERVRLASEALESTRVQVERFAVAASQGRARRSEAESTHEAALTRLNQAGGIQITQLTKRIEDAEQAKQRVVAARDGLAKQLTAIGVEMPRDAAEFAELLAVASREADTESPAPVGTDLHDAHKNARDRVAHLEAELRELRQRRSNIDGHLLRARAALAQATGLGERELPFAGELIDVRPEHEEWTGAIERVLASLSTTILVRDTHAAEVRRAVNARHWGARLVVDVVTARSDAPVSTSERSLFRRVDVAAGQFADHVNNRLSREFDYACVDHPDELDSVDRGVTIQGLVKRSRRGFEKDDRFQVNDRNHWSLGSSNEPKIQLLEQQLVSAQRELGGAKAQLDDAGGERDRAMQRRTTLALLVATDPSTYDLEGAEHHVQSLRRELEMLTKATDLVQAAAAEQESRLARDQARSDAADAEASERLARSDAERYAEILREAQSVSVGELTVSATIALSERFRSATRNLTLENIDRVQSEVKDALNDVERQASNRRGQATNRFAEQAANFRSMWETVLPDLTTSIEDRSGYRIRLAEIRERGLPEYEADFLALLRDRSRDTVIHLRDEILAAPRRVQDRVDPVNTSLGRSQFDKGRYLMIVVKEQRSSEVTDFLGDLRAVVDGNWTSDDMVSAERRFTVLASLMRKLGSGENADQRWRQRVLDTREHVTFQAQERDPAGTVLNVHESGAGLSGGQRQKLVIFCLAAALRYQLADPDEFEPRYGTVILDEAFDKADSAYTRMAMDVFVTFGFHMILATPQKLLTTLETYIGAITSVSNPDRNRSRLQPVDWERSA